MTRLMTPADYRRETEALTAALDTVLGYRHQDQVPMWQAILFDEHAAYAEALAAVDRGEPHADLLVRDAADRIRSAENYLAAAHRDNERHEQRHGHKLDR